MRSLRLLPLLLGLAVAAAPSSAETWESRSGPPARMPSPLSFGKLLDLTPTRATKVADGANGHDLIRVEGTARYDQDPGNRRDTSVIVQLADSTQVLLPGQTRWEILVTARNFRGLPAIRGYQNGWGVLFQGRQRVGDLPLAGSRPGEESDASVGDPQPIPKAPLPRVRLRARPLADPPPAPAVTPRTEAVEVEAVDPETVDPEPPEEPAGFLGLPRPRLRPR